jgi:catechol 2,3-dioxygenase-like lactoylglutathione lyase family enzyme
VSVPVRDVRAAATFFSDVLGFVPQQSRSDAVVVTNGVQAIDLLPTRKCVFGPVRLAFVVGDPLRLAAIAAGPSASQGRPASVRVAGPEGLAVTVCLDARLASDAVLRDVLADA